jgi:hypothetical protein
MALQAGISSNLRERRIGEISIVTCIPLDAQLQDYRRN